MDDKETQVKDYIAMNSQKLVPKLLKVFNSFDLRCRQMAISNPGRPMSDYCEKCQERAKLILGDE